MSDLLELLGNSVHLIITITLVVQVNRHAQRIRKLEQRKACTITFSDANDARNIQDGMHVRASSADGSETK